MSVSWFTKPCERMYSIPPAMSKDMLISFSNGRYSLLFQYYLQAYEACPQWTFWKVICDNTENWWLYTRRPKKCSCKPLSTTLSPMQHCHRTLLNHCCVTNKLDFDLYILTYWCYLLRPNSKRWYLVAKLNVDICVWIKGLVTIN